MGPMILIDKSALQSFSQREIGFLTKHYLVVIPPILLTEILGDLNKTNDSPFRNEVQQLSNKLGPLNSTVIVPWRDLCVGNLIGHELPMDGRIPRSGGTEVKDPEGKIGIFYDEAPEMAILRNWKMGDFSDTDKLFAARWKEATGSINLEQVSRQMKLQSDTIKRPSDMRELQRYVKKVLLDSSPLKQENWLKFLIRWLNSSQEFGSFIGKRWMALNRPLIQAYAPYAYFCLRVKAIFDYGLAWGLISTRNTNVVDLEYLFHLPFCMVFCSSDKFHRSFSGMFLRNNQEFVWGDDLKADLGRLADEWDALNAEQKEDRAFNYGSYPPQIQDSITHQLWVKNMRPWKPGSGNQVLRMTEKERENVMAQVRPMVEAMKKQADSQALS